MTSECNKLKAGVSSFRAVGRFNLLFFLSLHFISGRISPLAKRSLQCSFRRTIQADTMAPSPMERHREAEPERRREQRQGRYRLQSNGRGDRTKVNTRWTMALAEEDETEDFYFVLRPRTLIKIDGSLPMSDMELVRVCVYAKAANAHISYFLFCSSFAVASN